MLRRTMRSRSIGFDDQMGKEALPDLKYQVGRIFTVHTRFQPLTNGNERRQRRMVQQRPIPGPIFSLEMSSFTSIKTDHRRRKHSIQGGVITTNPRKDISDGSNEWFVGRRSRH
jgi:hypothetical protein